MKSLRYILSATFILSLSISTDIVEAKNPSILENEIDVILADLRQLITNTNTDGIPLPSSEDSFSATGHVWVGDGQIKGISSIHRSGNVTFGKCPDDRTVYQFQIAVGLTDLQGKYSSSFKLGPFSNNFGIGIQISSVGLDITIFPSNSTVKTCHLNTSNSYKITLNGIGFFDTKLYSMLIDFVTIILQPVIHDQD
ncbi:hypothetical protein Anas_09233 [Armadillidium nasatum]|uniref:Uncharacterized protein n=1 Tax=Armadillidium nasatum TaxID=96803 RepID=A0A5N5SZ47_9CRUS|nr:hypothetical protein Anas_09233 [Armadillidium nasatum]